MKLKSILAAATIAAAFVAGPAFAQDKGTVGISMPTKSSTRWISDGDSMVKEFQAAGYDTILQYAEDDIPTQLSQVENMIVRGVDALVIAAIDGTTLTDALAQAAASDIPVVAYDRLIRNSGDVSYYTTFDNFKVGQEQGQALLDGLAAKFPDKDAYNIELFAGSPDDPNAAVFFNGAMEILQPKIDDGTLTVVSGQTEFTQVTTQGWAPEEAQSRADTLIQSNYGSTELDGVLSPNDTLARAVITSVEEAGKPDIVITGQDSEAASIPLIMSGKQYMTIYKDTRRLVAAALEMVTALAAGDEPETTTTENNKSVDVPTYYLDPVVVTAENAAEVYADNPDLEPLTQQ